MQRRQVDKKRDYVQYDDVQTSRRLIIWSFQSDRTFDRGFSATTVVTKNLTTLVPYNAWRARNSPRVRLKIGAAVNLEISKFQPRKGHFSLAVLSSLPSAVYVTAVT